MYPRAYVVLQYATAVLKHLFKSFSGVMRAGVHAGLWWVMSVTNRLIGINWTCLSHCVDGELRESVFSIHKFAVLIQGPRHPGPP